MSTDIVNEVIFSRKYTEQPKKSWFFFTNSQPKEKVFSCEVINGCITFLMDGNPVKNSFLCMVTLSQIEKSPELRKHEFYKKHLKHWKKQGYYAVYHGFGLFEEEFYALTAMETKLRHQEALNRIISLHNYLEIPISYQRGFGQPPLTLSVPAQMSDEDILKEYRVALNKNYPEPPKHSDELILEKITEARQMHQVLPEVLQDKKENARLTIEKMGKDIQSAWEQCQGNPYRLFGGVENPLFLEVEAYNDCLFWLNLQYKEAA